MKQYKIVHFVPKLKGGVFLAKGDAIELQLEQVINGLAAEGWNFVTYQAAHVAIEAGCLASLFGRKNESMDYDIIVFERDA